MLWVEYNLALLCLDGSCQVKKIDNFQVYHKELPFKQLKVINACGKLQ